MTMKHPAERAMVHIAAMRRNGRSPNKIARHAIMAAAASDFPIEQLDLTADERAAVPRELAAAKRKRAKERLAPVPSDEVVIDPLPTFGGPLDDPFGSE
jgi:hypothetical protein